MSTTETGNKGELLARNYLEDKGYTILDHNWRNQHLELDIVAQKDGKLVVVEVKTGKGFEFGILRSG